MNIAVFGISEAGWVGGPSQFSEHQCQTLIPIVETWVRPDCVGYTDSIRSYNVPDILTSSTTGSII